MPVALPGFMPTGFARHSVDADTDETFGPSYRVRYQHPDGAFVLVEGAAAGLGDVMRGARRDAFDTVDLGPGVLEWYDEDSDEPVEFRSHWLSPSAEPPAYGVAGRGLIRDDALRIAKSLAFVES